MPSAYAPYHLFFPSSASFYISSFLFSVLPLPLFSLSDHLFPVFIFLSADLVLSVSVFASLILFLFIVAFLCALFISASAACAQASMSMSVCVFLFDSILLSVDFCSVVVLAFVDYANASINGLPPSAGCYLSPFNDSRCGR